MAFPVNAELVAVHWLRSLGLGADVATTLPDRSASFAANGFVQVPVIPGGAPDLDTPRRSSLVQVDAFAYTEGSTSPPWGKAATLLQRVEAAVAGQNVHGTVTTPAAYEDARLMGAAVNSSPSRVVDPGGMARYSMLVQLWWVPIPEEG